MKILRPSKNSQTQGYSDSHKGYDFSGRGDTNAYACFFGKVTQAKNTETRNWLAFKDGDPYKDTRNGKLLTADYGNYCKIKGEVDGQTYYALYAHLETNTVPAVGTEVKEGQVLAKIDNTGNSTGSHLHFELRDVGNVNIRAEFKDQTTEPPMEDKNKEQEIRDIYKGTTGEWPNDDEVKARLQENKNIVEQIEDRLRGDERAKKRWMEEWGLEQDINKDVMIEQYREFVLKMKEIGFRIGLISGAELPEVVSKFEWVVDEYKRLIKETAPKTIYKYEGKDFSKILTIGNLLIALENERN